MTFTDYIFAKTAKFTGRVVESWYAKFADLFDRGILCRHGVMCDEYCLDCLADQMDLTYIRREIEHVLALEELNEIYAQ